MVVYNLHCKCCGKDYVEKTQNHLRKRTDTHYYESWLAVKGHFKIHLLDMLPDNAKT
jgi:hypothetical protein